MPIHSVGGEHNYKLDKFPMYPHQPPKEVRFHFLFNLLPWGGEGVPKTFKVGIKVRATMGDVEGLANILVMLQLVKQVDLSKIWPTVDTNFQVLTSHSMYGHIYRIR